MNDNEPIVLGKIKKGKTGKPLVVLIIFIFAGALIFLLPSINEYFGDNNIIDLVKNGQIIDFFINHDLYVDKHKVNNTTTTKKVEKVESKPINKKTLIEYNNFSLSNFTLTKNNITYTIKTSNKINFDDSNYYLILEKNKKEIKTIKLTSEIISEGTNTFKFIDELDSTLEIRGYVKVIEEKDYPIVKLSSDETGLSSLICQKDNDKYEYVFNNNLLIKINETYKYIDNGNQNEYLKQFEEYSNVSNDIILNNGVSNIEETFEGFIFKTEIDLTTYTHKINSNYYSYNTKSNKVDFEMKAKGYDCK